MSIKSTEQTTKFSSAKTLDSTLKNKENSKMTKETKSNVQKKPSLLSETTLPSSETFTLMTLSEQLTEPTVQLLELPINTELLVC